MIFEICKLPDIFRLGVVTPCYERKGKPISDPNSYRKINVTSALCYGWCATVDVPYKTS
jgi:hypothetical protein